jgi:hypothetical protein
MASKYWVGGGSSTNADATSNTNWALTSGGARNAAVPTTGDDVIFDGVSNGGDGHAQDACVWNIAVSLATMDFTAGGSTGYTGAISGNSSVTITGLKFKFSTGMSTTWAGTLTFSNTSGSNVAITCGGKTFAQSIIFDGVGGIFQLQDAFALTSTRTVTLTNGTFNMNSQTFSAGNFIFNNSNTRVISNSPATWTLTGVGNNFNGGSSTGLTISYPTTINFTDATSGTISFQSTLTGWGTVNRSAGTGNLVFANNPSIAALNLTGYTGTTVTGTLNVSGNVTLVSSLTSASTTTITMNGTSGTQQLTMGSTATAINITVNGVGGTTQLQDTFTSTGTLTLTNGTLNINSKALTVGVLSSNNSNTRVISNPGTTWTLTGTGTVHNFGTTTGLTVTWPTTIKMTDSSSTARTFAGGGKTYNNVWHAPGAGTATLTITGANVFGDFKDDGSAAHQNTWPASTTNTFTTFTVSGTAGNLISLRSSSTPTKATLSCASGTINCDYLDIQDSAATGGAIWKPGAHSTNSGNNTGWLFTSLGVLYMHRTQQRVA